MIEPRRVFTTGHVRQRIDRYGYATQYLIVFRPLISSRCGNIITWDRRAVAAIEL